MKKYFYFTIILLLGFILASCDDDPTGPNPVEDTGSLIITTSPAGAEIFIDNSSTGISPDTIEGLSAGSHEVTLQLANYKDTTFTVVIEKDLTTSKFVQLISDITTTTYGDVTPIRIYETTGTTAAQPSGLDLSTGTAVSSSNAEADIYYFSSSNGSTFEIRSGNQKATSFKVGNSSDLFDGVPSPLAVPSWDNKMSDRETNYVFLFDSESHYSKIKIVGFGGGTPGNPAYVDLEWIYNETPNDVRFPAE